jgi:membrane associated rhomboid family serine protease
MFLHGGLFHIGGNMLYLWIFGKSVEQTLGHGRYLVFYLTAGVGAALGQTLASSASTVPMIGASGAVSGVLGAYLLLFPHARVMTLLVLGFFVRVVPVPAAIVLGAWIIVQFVNGLVTTRTGMGSGVEAAGGVAWFAHLGGVAAGMLLLLVLRPRASRRIR